MTATTSDPYRRRGRRFGCKSQGGSAKNSASLVINVSTITGRPLLQALVQVNVEFENNATVQIFNGRKFGSRRIIAEFMKGT